MIPVGVQAAEQLSNFAPACQEGFFPAWGTVLLFI